MPDFHATPTLLGTHVRLEALAPQHAEGVLAAADSDEVFRWLALHRPTDLDAARALVAHYIAHPGLSAWAQVDVRTDRVAGLTTYYDTDSANRTVAIGHTWIAHRNWRTGLNTEAKLLLLRRAFDDLGCVRVVWHTDILNTRSQDAIGRLGAQREGVLRKHRLRQDGSWRDTVTFSMIDDEWPAARDALEQRLARHAD